MSGAARCSGQRSARPGHPPASLALALRESTLALRTLKLDRQKKTRITLVGVTAFADSLSRATCRLEILSFSGNKSVDCACAGKLAEAVQSRRGEHSALTELYLSGTSVSDAGASQLAPVLYLLSTVSLSGCRIGVLTLGRKPKAST